MHIKDYNYNNNLGLKVSKNSITVKNIDTLKTAGVIRGIKTWESLNSTTSMRDLLDFKEILKNKLKNSNIDITEIQKNCVLIQGEIYYLYNIQPYLKFKNSFEDVATRHNKVNEIRKYIDVIDYIPH